MTISQAIADLAIQRPDQFMGVALFALACIAAPICLAIGAWQHWYSRPHRAMRRRLRYLRRR